MDGIISQQQGTQIQIDSSIQITSIDNIQDADSMVCVHTTIVLNL